MGAEFQNLRDEMAAIQRRNLVEAGHGNCDERIATITRESDGKDDRIRILNEQLATERAEMVEARTEIDSLRLLLVESHDLAENVISGLKCGCGFCEAFASRAEVA